MDFGTVTALLLAVFSCQTAALRSPGTHSPSQTELRHKSRQLLQAGKNLPNPPMQDFLLQPLTSLKNTGQRALVVAFFRHLYSQNPDLIPVNMPEPGTCINIPYTNLGGNLLVDGAANLQLSSSACCQSCWSQLKQAANGAGCNAWVWCGQPAGCNNGYGTVYPYQQCTLKFQPNLQAAKPSINTTSRYGTSDFTSGWIPIWSQPVDQTPSLSGYNRYNGIDYAGFFDYSCPNSVATGGYCQLSGTVQTVALSCSADASCRAFVYLPGRNTAFLKGGNGVDLTTVQSLGFATPNPDAVMYIKASSS